MKNLVEIKDDYAKELGWNSFPHLLLNVDGTRGMLDRDYNEVAKRYASQLRPEWIKIESEEDFPTEHGEYIVRLKSGKIKGATYYAESKRFYTGGNVNDNPVTHWMPLPEPPKED